MELLLEIHGAHVVGLETLHGAGKQSALKTADERLTELAALLLPAVAVVMGEGYDQIGEDGEVDGPCGERHPCECAAQRVSETEAASGPELRHRRRTRAMKATHVTRLLANPARVIEHFGNGGWRRYLGADLAERYDQCAEDRAALDAALTPGGWAHDLREWAHTQQICLRRNGNGSCSLQRYMGLTAAASAYLVIDLQSAGYRLSAKEWQDERDAQAAAAPVKRPHKLRNVRAELPADDEEVQTTPRYQPRLLPNEDGCGVWDSWVSEWVSDEPGQMLADVYAECDELNAARALAATG